MSSLNNELAQRIRSHPSFLRAYEELQRESLASLLQRAPELAPSDARKLAQSAVALARSDEADDWKLAQDIAWALIAATDDSAVHATSSHALNLLGNFPGQRFVRRSDEAVGDLLPWTVQLQELGREETNTAVVLGKSYTFTDFQFHAWEHLKNSAKALAVRAPTSAGKSFLVQVYLQSRFEKVSGLTVAYIVPSRALLHEVQGNLSRLFAQSDNHIAVSSVPRAVERSEHVRGCVYVLTQERLQSLLESSPDEVIDELIVDEAQQISDDARGVLLQECIESAIQRNAGTRLVLLTPGRQDASRLGATLGLPPIVKVESVLRPVRQNLVYVDFDHHRPSSLVLSLHRSSSEKLPLGELVTDWGFQTKSGRLVGAVLHLGREGQSLVYAAGKADAEKTSLQLASNLEEAPDEDRQLKNLVDFIRKHIHPKYPLAETVRRGVGYHYGMMPTALSKTLEEYFDAGHLKYLVCTSTLLHGVNLPARNIFLHKPMRGKDKPIDADGFWNLAGRAGRMSRETHGNVFLIDYTLWDSKPVSTDSVTPVRTALETVMTEEVDALSRFASDAEHASGDKKTDAYEATFTRLCLEAMSGVDRLGPLVDRLSGSLESDKRYGSLIASVERVVTSLTLPLEVVRKNPLVSPVRQQSLYGYFLERIEAGELERLVPLHPAAPFLEARSSLVRVFSDIERKLRKSSSNRGEYYAGLAVKWMRGASIRDLVDNAAEYQSSRTKRSLEELNYQALIRKTLEEVEKELRFYYVRYTGCYVELLKAAIATSGVDFKREIPNLPLYLELGASTPTMVSCLELGMSRIAASEASDAMANSQMEPKTIKAWITRNHATGVLSPLVVRELKRLGLA